MNKATLLCLVTAMTAGTAVFTGCGSESDDGDGTSGGCFDYSSFNGDEPETKLRGEALVVLQTSCGIAGGTCHGIPNNDLPGALPGEPLATR